MLEAVDAFGEGGQRYLMYKDWEALERFAEEIDSARDAGELSRTLHRFEAYLETLFGQVNMRAVLADHPFDPKSAPMSVLNLRTSTQRGGATRVTISPKRPKAERVLFSKPPSARRVSETV